MNPRFFKWLAATAFVFSTLFVGAAQAQGFSRPLADLNVRCEHLFFIEQRFIAEHIVHQKFTPELEKQVIDQVIKRLDPSKIYLMASDIPKIKKSLHGVFKKTKVRNCDPIFAAYKTLETRVKERSEFATKFLKTGFKFDKETEFVFDPDVREFAKNNKELNDFHGKYLQFQIANYLIADDYTVELKKLEEAKELEKKGKKAEAKKIREKAEKAIEKKIADAKDLADRRYQRNLRRVEEKQKHEILAEYLDSFARGLDPHSSFYSRDALEDFRISMSLELQGIGATLSSRDGFTIIEQLIPGGAAFRSGKLKPKDKIIAVDESNDGKMVSVIEMDLRDVVKKIRGPKGTKVKLSILRKQAEGNERFSIVLVRDKIKLEDEAARIHYVEREVGGEKKLFGLIDLPSFYSDGSRGGRSAAADMKKLVDEARKKKVEGLVLDLSTNGGGALDDAVNIAGLFIRRGNVVKQSNKDRSRPVPLADLDTTVDWSGPLTILISRVSASASEIVAGTLKDYKRAVIVGGDHTFGKGTVQSVTNLPRGLGGLKTTVGMFFTAGGKSTQHIGVDSDVVFPSLYSTDEVGEKTLDYSLPPKTIKSFLSKQAYVKDGPDKWEPVNSTLIKKLNERSQARIKTNEDFKKIIKDKKKIADRGKTIRVAELFDNKDEGSEDKDDEGGIDYNSVKDSEVPKGMSKDEYIAKLRKEKQVEDYLDRADIQEAINIVADQVAIQKGLDLKLGATNAVKDQIKN